MAVKRSARLVFVFLAAVLFALHFQLMPAVATHQHPDKSAHVVMDHQGQSACHGGCCVKASCCIQSTINKEASTYPPQPEQYELVSHRARPLPTAKPLDPPPRLLLA
jgi:hypothetical protein